MTDLLAAKALVLRHYDALAMATPDTVADILAERTAPGWHWRGMHPWYEQQGAADVAAAFWAPLLTAFNRVQRRQDIFFAGEDHQGVGGTWVVSMGHLLALFDAPLLGIPPTRKIVMLRYCEFNRVENGQITETTLHVDLVHLMHQAGLNPLPTQTGAHLVQPGPATHDGLLFDATDPAEGETTRALIEAMCNRISASGRKVDPQAELPHDWHQDMLWWGPDGIGATYTIDRYAEQHQAPFRQHLKDRAFVGHLARVTEGNYGAFFGWPNLRVTPLGGWLGLPGNGAQPVELRVIDVYRRDGDKLAENWIFIDILHYLSQQGLNVLDRLTGAAPNSS